MDPLIHIGYHKTGTTWLQRVLFTATHGFAPVRPKDVIDRAFVVPNQFAYDPATARTLVAAALEGPSAETDRVVISHERLSGFDLLGSYDARPIADRLYAAYPDGRVLIVVREQRSMMLSMYKQYLRKTGSARIDELWRERSPRELRQPVARLDTYEYHHLVAYYQRLFGPDRVAVLPYELMAGDLGAFVGAIRTFAGVGARAAPEPVRANPSVASALTGTLRRTNRFLQAVGVMPAYGAGVMSNRMDRTRLRAIRALSRRVPRRIEERATAKMRSTIDTIVGDRYAASNGVLQTLTGLDLASLGYRVPTG